MIRSATRGVLRESRLVTFRFLASHSTFSPQSPISPLAPPVAAVQTALAFSGAVVGPPLFALIAALVSYRMAFFAVAACVLAAAIWQLLAARVSASQTHPMRT